MRCDFWHVETTPLFCGYLWRFCHFSSAQTREIGMFECSTVVEMQQNAFNSRVKAWARNAEFLELFSKFLECRSIATAHTNISVTPGFQKLGKNSGRSHIREEVNYHSGKRDYAQSISCAKNMQSIFWHLRIEAVVMLVSFSKPTGYQRSILTQGRWVSVGFSNSMGVQMELLVGTGPSLFNSVHLLLK